MKSHLIELLISALKALSDKNVIAEIQTDVVQVERTRDAQFGDFSSNVALILAKSHKLNPRELAQNIIKHLPHSEWIEKVEMAGPGFINFRLTASAIELVVKQIFAAKDHYGLSTAHAGEKIHIEYVSANPTGPLHVGHGRSAAYGACVANLLKAVGFQVHREYYVNDAGRQMRILAFSTWVRYLQILGLQVNLPASAYQGEYIIDTATKLKQQYQERFKKNISADQLKKLEKVAQETDADRAIDNCVHYAIEFLGVDDFAIIQQVVLQDILDDIRDDLTEFGVVYDNWFNESQLIEMGLVKEGVALLEKHNHIYQREGATWFRATEFGDEKDRVLVRENGQATYFASDVAYHLYKYQKNYDRIIDIFGADHHGYIARVKAFLQGLGEDPQKLAVLLVQFAILYRGKEKVSMSTRSGSFVTLRALRQEVGNDAARFFYVMRRPDQHLDFDLELAKAQSNENPVYYIQYAHARICSVWKQNEYADDEQVLLKGLEFTNLLTKDSERNLLRQLSAYPEIIYHAAIHYEPHLLAHYLQELAGVFHLYYNSEKFLVPDQELRQARLCLIKAVQWVIAGGLLLLGINAPEEM